MKIATLSVMTILIFSMTAIAKARYYEDPRNVAVLNSSMIKKSLAGLKAEQNLSCKMTFDESGQKTIQYFEEEGLSKFKALFLCSDGRAAIFTGVIGDGGQTATEKFELMTAQ